MLALDHDTCIRTLRDAGQLWPNSGRPECRGAGEVLSGARRVGVKIDADIAVNVLDQRPGETCLSSGQVGEDVFSSTVLLGGAEHVLRLLFYRTPLRMKLRCKTKRVH